MLSILELTDSSYLQSSQYHGKGMYPFSWIQQSLVQSNQINTKEQPRCAANIPQFKTYSNNIIK